MMMHLRHRLLWTSGMLCLFICITGCSRASRSSSVVVATQTSLPAPATPTPLTYREPFNEKVDVGGYKLSIKCIGTGNPTVVLDAGLDGTGDTWIKVWPQLKRITRACIYDRAGLGESERGPVPRTSQTIATELHTLLLNAGIEGPYVLVGHSFGGLNIRIFTNQYLDQVAGVVLVDATHEDEIERASRLLPPSTPGECQALAAARNVAVTNREGVDVPASTEQVRHARPTLGDVPLIVLSHGRASPLPANCDISVAVNEHIEQLHQALQSQLAGLSSNSILRIAEKSGHQIQIDQPELVIEAIEQVVRAAKTHTHLTAP